MPAAALIPLVLVIAVGIWVLLARWRGSHALGGDVVVRCPAGHLFTTIWVPLVSFKAIRLGWVRFQHCPVGDHWTFVVPVRESDLTAAQRRAAHQQHDTPVP